MGGQHIDVDPSQTGAAGPRVTWVTGGRLPTSLCGWSRTPPGGGSGP